MDRAFGMELHRAALPAVWLAQAALETQRPPGLARHRVGPHKTLRDLSPASPSASAQNKTGPGVGIASPDHHLGPDIRRRKRRRAGRESTRLLVFVQKGPSAQGNLGSKQ